MLLFADLCFAFDCALIFSVFSLVVFFSFFLFGMTNDAHTISIHFGCAVFFPLRDFLFRIVFLCSSRHTPRAYLSHSLSLVRHLLCTFFFSINLRYDSIRLDTCVSVATDFVVFIPHIIYFISLCLSFSIGRLSSGAHFNNELN